MARRHPHDTGRIDTATPIPADDRAPGERQRAPERQPWGRASDHLMPASIVGGAPEPNDRRSRRARRAARRVAGASPVSRPALLLLGTGVVLAAWLAGLSGAVVGNEVANRRGDPPRRPSTLGLSIAAPRDVEPPAIDVARVADEVGISVVSIHRTGGSDPSGTTGDGDASGTGLVVTADGEILTNAHVVGDAATVDVRLPGEREPRPGAVIAVDPGDDLALVRIDADGLTPAVFAAPDDIRVGDEVVAIGFALDLDGDPSITRGVVSALERTLTTRAGVLDGLVQTDAAISSGNSGGPLVNAFGRVVGINTAVAYGDVDTAANSLGFAIGVAELVPELADLRATAAGDEVRQGYLGVGLASRRDGGGGALVTQVEEGSPADLAGLAVDDVVVTLDGREVLGDEDLIASIRDLRPGAQIDLAVVRDGVTLELTVVLGTRAIGTDN